MLELADAVREAAGAAGHFFERVGEVAFEQRAHDGASGQAAGALEQHHVVLVCVDVGFLEAVGGVALFGRGEARAHLDAARAELYRFVDVLRVPDAARSDDGDAEAELADVFHERGNDFLEREFLVERLFFATRAEVSARGVGRLDDEGVGDAVVVLEPAADDEARGLDAADYRDERSIGVALCELRQLERKSGAGDYHVRARLARGAHEVFVVAERAHAVDRDDAAVRGFLRLFYVSCEDRLIVFADFLRAEREVEAV